MSMLILPVAVIAAGIGLARPATALAAGSAQVGYLTDGSNGGFNLWQDNFGLVNIADGGTYTTRSPATAQTVTIHNVDMTKLDTPSSTSLSGLDTLVVYLTCDIGSHPNAVKAINAFLDAGNKVVFLDGAQCVVGNGGPPSYSLFEKPFQSNNQPPVPQYGSKPYTAVESSTLAAHLPDCTPAPGCNEAGNSVGDANVFSPGSANWCQSLGATNTNNFSGPVEAYTRNNAGSGLVVWSGEAWGWPSASTAHMRLVFDDILNQAWNTDGLPCSSPIAWQPPVTIAETHLAVLMPVIGLIALGGVMLTVAARRRRSPGSTPVG